ncbi:MAG: lysylphosphatidylglycerol synthase domain-containing protein [Chloroflexota bacterium]
MRALPISAIRAVVGLALAGGVAYALWVTWHNPRLEPLAWQLRPLPLAGGLALMLGVALVSVPCWLVIFRQLGGRLSAWDALHISLVTNLGKYLPGKVMHAAGRVAMLQAKGQSISISIASIAVDVGLSLLAAALVSLLSLPLFLHEYGLTENLTALIPVWLLVVPLGLVGLHPKVVRFGLQLCGRVLPGAALDPATPVPAYSTIVPMLGARIGLWLTMAMALFLTARTVYPLEWGLMPAMSGVAGVSYLFGLAVPFAPSGIGAREGLMTVLLATMMPAPEAAATSVLFRIVSILSEVLAAGGVMAASRLRGSQDTPTA